MTAVMLVLTSGVAPVLAQGYYGQQPGGYGPPRGGYDEDYDRRRRYDQDRDYDRQRRGGYDDRDYDRRRSAGPRGGGSSTCVTSRGVCPIGAVVPRLTPCRCDIPGFGEKRGASQ